MTLGKALLCLSLYSVSSGLLAGNQLTEALQIVRKNSPETPELEQKMLQVDSKKKALNQFFEPVLEFSGSHATDKSVSQANPWEKLTRHSGSASWKRQSSLGTRYSLELYHQVTRLEFPAFERTPQTPVGPGDSFQINPEFESGLKMQVEQPLLRHWMSREIELKKTIMDGEKIGPYFTRKIILQNIQGETEFLYVNLMEIRRKIKILKDILNLSTRFYKLMVKREHYGRAEKLDIADAKSREVEVSGQLLQLEIAEKQIYLSLKNRLNSKPEDVISFRLMPMDQPFLKLPESSLEGMQAYALKNRLELKMYEQSRDPLKIQLALAREEDRSDLSLFSTVQINAQETSSGDSFSKMKNPKWAVGLRWTMPLGSHPLHSIQEEQGYQNKELDHKEQLVRFQIKKDLEIAFHQLQTSEDLVRQARSHQSILKSLLKEERKRISQARSDKVAAIRYEIDILKSEMDEVSAYKKAREAEALIRVASHAYQSEN